VKVAAVVAALGLALVLQTTLAEFLGRGAAAVDLVLVVVVYVALSSGPTTGLLAGAAAGLAQDALSSGIIGIGGLAKTVVGFLAGVMGTQFIVVRALPRFVVFLLATVLHAVLFMGAYELLDLRRFGVPYAGVLSQAAANAFIGVVAFHVVDLLPGYMERRAAMRGRTVRRRLD
jgi:rod shape-determining protein MreD